MKKVDCTRGSGNVFSELGLPNADERLLKAQLAVQIRRFIGQKDWTQAEAAEAASSVRIPRASRV